MTTTEQSIEVNVPIITAYDQWIQFEGFSEFRDGIANFSQIDDNTTCIVMKMDRELEAEQSIRIERDLQRFKKSLESRAFLTKRGGFHGRKAS